MKIVFVIATLPAGGAQTMLLRLLERLNPRWSPHVISLSTLGEVGPRIGALGIPVEAIGMKPGRPSFPGFIRLVRRLKSLAPDIVHTWMYHADLLGGVAARLAGVPHVIWGIRHANLDTDKNKRSTLAVVRVCSLLSSHVPEKILSNSEKACRVHAARGYAKQKMVVIPNGFDLTMFRPDEAAPVSVRAELGIPPESPIAGFIARFHPQKNVAGFFDAAARLHRRMPDVHFVLAGQGLDLSGPAIARAVESAGVGHVTRLLGIRNDIPRLMAAMDVLALSSSGEAFPNVVGEAMACGVPCVATDAGEAAHMVGNTGRVVQPGDMPGLAEALEELLRLPRSERAALGARARERVAGHFEIGHIVTQYERLYSELCGLLCVE